MSSQDHVTCVSVHVFVCVFFYFFKAYLVCTFCFSAQPTPQQPASPVLVCLTHHHCWTQSTPFDCTEGPISLAGTVAVSFLSHLTLCYLCMCQPASHRVLMHIPNQKDRNVLKFLLDNALQRDVSCLHITCANDMVRDLRSPENILNLY